MKKVLKKTVGVLLLPLLYIRYALVIILILFIATDFNSIIGLYAIYYIIGFGFIMGNLFGMNLWTKVWGRIFKIKYEIIENGYSSDIIGRSVYHKPTIRINEKEYKFSIVVMGSNLYEKSASIRRKAIFIHLFN